MDDSLAVDPTPEIEPENPGYINFKLSKPVTFEKVTYESIKLGLGGLLGSDLRNLKQEFALLKRQEKGFVMPRDLFDDDDYLLLLHGRVNKLPLEFFDLITAADYISVTKVFREAIRSSSGN